MSDILAAHGKRLSVPLTPHDLADLELLRNSSERMDVLPAGADVSSEAGLVHAVFEAGLQHIRQLSELAGYEAYANDPEYVEYRSTRRSGGERRRQA